MFVKFFLVTFHDTGYRNVKVWNTNKINILLETPDCVADAKVTLCSQIALSGFVESLWDVCAFSYTQTHVLLCLNSRHAHSWCRTSHPVQSHASCDSKNPSWERGMKKKKEASSTESTTLLVCAASRKKKKQKRWKIKTSSRCLNLDSWIHRLVSHPG